MASLKQSDQQLWVEAQRRCRLSEVIWRKCQGWLGIAGCMRRGAAAR